MAIPAIPPISPALAITPPVAPSAAQGASAAGSSSFANILGNAIDQLQGVTDNAQSLALAGAAGEANIANVTVASTEAELAVQLVTTTRDKAVNAFNSIMSMST